MFSPFIIAGLASVGTAQYSGWDLENGQINSTMCTWRALRGRTTAHFDKKTSSADRHSGCRERHSIYGWR